MGHQKILARARAMVIYTSYIQLQVVNERQNVSISFLITYLNAKSELLRPDHQLPAVCPAIFCCLASNSSSNHISRAPRSRKIALGRPRERADTRKLAHTHTSYIISRAMLIYMYDSNGPPFCRKTTHTHALRARAP